MQTTILQLLTAAMQELAEECLDDAGNPLYTFENGFDVAKLSDSDLAVCIDSIKETALAALKECSIERNDERQYYNTY